MTERSHDMRWVPGRTFAMGSNRHYPEEAPVHRVSVDGFWLDRAPVTNAEFARFVDETGYVTNAELPPDPAVYPGILPELRRPGSLVFVKPSGPIDTRDFRRWWRFECGADWRHPAGAASTIEELADHPVVHVTYADAAAYAAWASKELPTEAQWELAARGGVEAAEFAWGDELAPGGKLQANFWQGRFPWENLVEDGYEGTSPIGAFPENAYGLVDLIGNVWEWTSDWYQAHTARSNTCCSPHDPRGGDEAASRDPQMPEFPIARKVLKGGSHLCAPNYCQRYRPAARYPQPIDTSTSHVGFRCCRR